MTDRYHAITVILARETREDDAQATIDAIAQLRNVAAVRPEVTDHAYYAAYERARLELRQRLLGALEEGS